MHIVTQNFFKTIYFKCILKYCLLLRKPNKMKCNHILQKLETSKFKKQQHIPPLYELYYMYIKYSLFT
jgi:hypothetical protein